VRFAPSARTALRDVTLFDRAASCLRFVDGRSLTVDDPTVIEAADWLGLVTA
jgi:hypothetical protein